jgi:hypothetical protein
MRGLDTASRYKTSEANRSRATVAAVSSRSDEQNKLYEHSLGVGGGWVG